MLKKVRNSSALIVADEMMIRKEGRTRRILFTFNYLSWMKFGSTVMIDLLFQYTKQEISVQTPLVGFVDHNDGVSAIRQGQQEDQLSKSE